SSTPTVAPVSLPIAHGFRRSDHRAIWLVKSQSTPNLWHLVSLHPSQGRITCDCASLRFRGRCIHVDLVLARITRAYQAAAVAIPVPIPTPPPPPVPTGDDSGDDGEYRVSITPAGLAALRSYERRQAARTAALWR